ncbi:MAG: ATP-binding protein [Clostridiales bacterium]|jgi:hypothetical protein|nr:ATP-binding protein [Clostridiales bacterium]
MEYKKITVFAGHYGSGKTNLAVNYALNLKSRGFDTALCDLDIVNPYFRSKDSERLLAERGIRVISSKFANTNLDVPAINPESYSIFAGDKKTYYVIDLGGDDRGAYALGRFSGFFAGLKSYEMIFVINMYRPETAAPEAAMSIMREIEAACRVKFTAIANNSNIGKATTRAHIANSVEYAERVAELSKLSIKMTCFMQGIDGRDFPNPYPIKIYTKEIWDI